MFVSSYHVNGEMIAVVDGVSLLIVILINPNVNIDHTNTIQDIFGGQILVEQSNGCG